MSAKKKSAATQDWEDALLHPHKEKAGFLPRAAGETEIEKIPQAAPSHGVSSHTDKSNEHSRKYGVYPKGKKKVMGGNDREG